MLKILAFGSSPVTLKFSIPNFLKLVKMFDAKFPYIDTNALYILSHFAYPPKWRLKPLYTLFFIRTSKFWPSLIVLFKT